MSGVVIGTWVSIQCFVLVSVKGVINKMSRTGKMETLRNIKTRSWGAVMAPAAWQLPEEIDANQFAVFEKRHSIRKLKDMAERMGLDTHLSKRNLALTVFTGTNVFFKSEIGNYSRETLLHFIRSFQILELKPSVEESLTNEHMRKLLLSVYEGGSHTDMVGHMDDLLLLYDQMMMMEQKFCSHYFQEILRSEVASEKMSMVDYIAQRLDDATERFDRWMTSSEKDRRVLYQDFLLHKERVRGMIQEFGSLIHEYCAKSTDVCADGNLPKALKEWYETSPNTRLIACNVTVRGKLVDFRKGDRLMNGRYKVSKVVEGMHQHHPVRWVGLVRLAKNLLQEEDEEKEDKDKKDKKEPQKNDPWYKILLHAIWSQKTQILMHLLNSRVGVANAIKVTEKGPIYGPENLSEKERRRRYGKTPIQLTSNDPFAVETEPPPPGPVFGPENLSEKERRRRYGITPIQLTSNDPFAVETEPTPPGPVFGPENLSKEERRRRYPKLFPPITSNVQTSNDPFAVENKKDPEPPPPDDTRPIFGPENLSPKERILFELKRRLRPPYAEAGLSLFEAAMAKLKEDMVNIAGEIPEATQRLINLYKELLKSSQQGSQVPPFVYFYRLALERIYQMDPSVENGFTEFHQRDAANMAVYIALKLQSLMGRETSITGNQYNATAGASDFQRTPFHDMNKLNPRLIPNALAIIFGKQKDTYLFSQELDASDKTLYQGKPPISRTSRVVEAEAFLSEDARKVWEEMKKGNVSLTEDIKEDIYKFHLGTSPSNSIMWKYGTSVAETSDVANDLRSNILRDVRHVVRLSPDPWQKTESWWTTVSNFINLGLWYGSSSSTIPSTDSTDSWTFPWTFSPIAVGKK